jgi:hypothetical protein
MQQGTKDECLPGLYKPKRWKRSSRPSPGSVVPEAAFPRRGELNVVVTVSAEKIIVNCQRCISGVSVGALRRNSEGQVVLAVFLYALHI